MPYTPPTQRSPAVSQQPDAPVLDGNGSYFKPPPPSSPYSSGPRPGLPRSASSTSYLHKYRRSPSSPRPSANTAGASASESTPKDDAAVTGDGRSMSSSLRQSPPPRNNLVIPTGAVMSPPDSGHNSSDDELTMRKGRERKLANLAELQAAISVIEQHREGSPSRQEEETKKAKVALGLVVRPLPPSSGAPGQSVGAARPPLSQEARKISHSRSATTDSTSYMDLSRAKKYSSPSQSSSDSDMEDDADQPRKKPPMVRKKSGELVRPALRPSSARRRPSSMPGTPTYSKAVHFDNQLEHVRHFLQVDKPAAVSASTSPVETYETEIEFPFDGREPTPSSFEWDIRLANFPADSAERSSMPVRVERVFLSADRKTLIGTIAVQNLAFNKTVVARFTLDYWKTTSEIVAEYSNDVRRKGPDDGCDRFNFNIRLDDQNNLENKTLFFCVRYNVNGQEFWDSNGCVNYQVNFVQNATPQKGGQRASGNVARPLTALPRSHSPTGLGSRPKSKSFDDFTHGFDPKYGFDSFPRPAPASAILADTPLKFRNKGNKESSGAKDGRGHRSNGPAQAFGNRYDFGASLSAAIQAASEKLGDRSGLSARHSPPEAVLKADGESKPKSAKGVPKPLSLPEVPRPTALTSEKPSVGTQPYNELINKYCFFGSSKGSPQTSRAGAGQTDGADDYVLEYDLARSGSSTPSPTSSPPVEEIPLRGMSFAAPRISRSSSPAAGSRLGPRNASPVSFGYPFHQPMRSGLAAATAIHG